MSLQWGDVKELQYLTWETEMNNLCQIATSKQKNTLEVVSRSVKWSTIYFTI